LQKHHF
jgi:hypothetical protein